MFQVIFIDSMKAMTVKASKNHNNSFEIKLNIKIDVTCRIKFEMLIMEHSYQFLLSKQLFDKNFS